ncbi:AAA family ATPase [Oscillibacter sp.]|uniref:ParA family protein n=1 Tax=Oscillibacter sp. TaxID=1945593 RepID=UPI0028AE2CE7|nr:AAA family ATPase [Oscillibacter sp.]
MAITISMINWKGGVGKTTLTLHVAAGLALRNKKVLVVDLDPQCNLSFLSLGLQKYIDNTYKNGMKTLKNVFDGYFDNEEVSSNNVIQKKLIVSSPGKVYTDLDIVLSHQDLVLLDLKLARNHKAGKDHKEDTRFEIDKISILHKLLSQVKQDYDYIFLDCPPNVNLVTQNAFFTSDYYLVPAIPDFLSTTGISLISNFMDDFNKDFNGMCAYAGLEEAYTPTKFAGIIFNMVDEYGGRPKQTHLETIDSIKKQFSNKVFTNYLTDGDGISAAASINIRVFAYDDLPRSNQNAKKQSEYLFGIVDEIIAKVK